MKKIKQIDIADIATVFISDFIKENAKYFEQTTLFDQRSFNFYHRLIFLRNNYKQRRKLVERFLEKHYG